MGLGNIIRNVRSRGLKDIANPKVWKVMASWFAVKAKGGITIPEDEIQDFAEQVVYRMSMCPECVKAKECLHCHCKMPEKAFVKEASCSAGKWGPMDPQWREYADREGITFIAISQPQ